MKTLNEQYRLIKEDKGHKGMFLTEAKRQFPNYVRTAASFHEAETILKQRGVINEGIVDLGAINNPFSTSKKESYEVAFEAFLAEAKKKENEDEKVKAIEKKPSKKVKEDADKNFDFDSGDELLTTFKQLKAVKEVPRETVASEIDKEARKQAVNTASVDTSGTSESSRKVYRRADLIKLQINDRAKYESMQDEIMAAYSEGRVR
jgi:hypothetical protein